MKVNCQRVELIRASRDCSLEFFQKGGDGEDWAGLLSSQFGGIDDPTHEEHATGCLLVNCEDKGSVDGESGR